MKHLRGGGGGGGELNVEVSASSLLSIFLYLQNISVSKYFMGKFKFP